MPYTITAQQFGDKWAQRMAAIMPDMTQKVMGSQKDWQRNTIGAQGVMVTQWNARCNQQQGGKWFDNVNATSNLYVKKQMVNIGIPRMGPGAQAAIPKVVAFATQFLPALRAAAQQVQAMPRGGLQNGIARATAMMTQVSAFRYNRTRS